MSRRRVLNQSTNTDVRIDLAPMLDVVFNLLIFFVVTATFANVNAITINTPESLYAEPTQGKILVLNLNQDNIMSAQHKGTELRFASDDIERIRILMADTGTKKVLIAADKMLSTENLLKAIDSAKSAGAETVDVAANKAKI